jgi:tetratricopeptide (TPR) repeat protein
MSQLAATQNSNEPLAEVAQAIARSLVRNPEQRAALLGEIFLACEGAAQRDPEGFRSALNDQELERFLAPHVRTALKVDSGESFSGGWLGTYIGADAREIEDDSDDTTDRASLEISQQALTRAFSLATQQGNQTLLRNLGWYRDRIEHKSYEAIARTEERIPATVRTGVARARKFLLRVVHELQNAQPAPLSGEASDEINALRELWVRQDLDELASELARTREQYSNNAQWLNLSALLAADRGQHEVAAELYERALVDADAPDVRGRVLNNLGNLADLIGESPQAACAYWMRAQQLVPSAPAPLMNLLVAASEARDYAAAQHHLSQFADLLNAGRLRPDERDYVQRRLSEHPGLCWLRDTDAWRAGPARWLRSWERTSRSAKRVAALALTALLACLSVALPGTAVADIDVARAPLTLASTERAGPELWARKTGGDSMGKPHKRWLRPGSIGFTQDRPLLAGDSMGRTGRKPGGRGPAS